DEHLKSNDTKIRELAQKGLDAMDGKKQPEIPEMQPADHRRRVAIKTMPDHDVAVTGHLTDKLMEKFLADVAAVRFTSQKDGAIYWRFAPEYLEGFKALCGQLKIEIS